MLFITFQAKIIMCIWSDITGVEGYEMHYVNASWQKRCVFNLDLNWESLSHKQYQEGLGAKCENALPPLD